VNPNPRSIETAAQPMNGPFIFHSHRYASVVRKRVAVPRRNDVRRPRVSAITPVGTSKSTIPAVKKAFAAKAFVIVRPASRRKRVFMPQIKLDAKVESRVSEM